ncbi:MAG: hypothetical protein NVV73_21990 [Cellvibrionaceae bacterium]|nr:hypothetical protein [Cellvibrionaceae bacterium]
MVAQVYSIYPRHATDAPYGSPAVRYKEISREVRKAPKQDRLKEGRSKIVFDQYPGQYSSSAYSRQAKREQAETRKVQPASDNNTEEKKNNRQPICHKRCHDYCALLYADFYLITFHNIRAGSIQSKLQINTRARQSIQEVLATTILCLACAAH